LLRSNLSVANSMFYLVYNQGFNVYYVECIKRKRSKIHPMPCARDAMQAMLIAEACGIGKPIRAFYVD